MNFTTKTNQVISTWSQFQNNLFGDGQESGTLIGYFLLNGVEVMARKHWSYEGNFGIYTRNTNKEAVNYNEFTDEVGEIKVDWNPISEGEMKSADGTISFVANNWYLNLPRKVCLRNSPKGFLKVGVGDNPNSWITSVENYRWATKFKSIAEAQRFASTITIRPLEVVDLFSPKSEFRFESYNVIDIVR